MHDHRESEQPDARSPFKAMNSSSMPNSGRRPLEAARQFVAGSAKATGRAATDFTSGGLTRYSSNRPNFQMYRPAARWAGR